MNFLLLLKAFVCYPFPVAKARPEGRITSCAISGGDGNVKGERSGAGDVGWWLVENGAHLHSSYSLHHSVEGLL